MLPFIIKEGELPFANGDYLFVPEIRKAVEEKAPEVKAYAVKDGQLTEFSLTLGDLTDEEREIIRKDASLTITGNKIPEKKENGMEEDKKKSGKTEHEMRWYISLAVLVFVLFCCCTMFFFMIYRYNGVSKGWDTIMRVLQPITFGLVIAYLINPIMKFFEKHLLHFLEPRVQKEKKCKKIARSIATGGAVVVFVLIVILLFAMMIPQLISSISGMVNSLPKQVDSFIDWFNGLTNSDNEIIQSLETNMMDMVTYLENWVKDSFLPNIQTYITSITSGVINMVKVLMNAIIGLIVSVYVLMTKEKFIGQSKKIVYAIFKPVRGNVIIDTFRKSNEIFGGFISGKLLDSAIIGVLCYICLLIMKMPYTLLVSVFVGLTNIIPFLALLSEQYRVLLSSHWQIRLRESIS